ncbi:MAG: hypothetical protein IPJ69_09380 [Deltaproteobacteria bacterium]|nr:MAG: hypothetical protein IPJ69_09380 [Deltaproteobacteria bacterium]
MTTSLKVMIAFDDTRTLEARENPEAFLKHPSRKTELNIFQALKNWDINPAFCRSWTMLVIFGEK